MIYGIDGGAVHRWGDHQTKHVALWLKGQVFDGEDFKTVAGRKAYTMPPGWRPNLPCTANDLADQIRGAGLEVVPA